MASSDRCETQFRRGVFPGQSTVEPQWRNIQAKINRRNGQTNHSNSELIQLPPEVTKTHLEVLGEYQPFYTTELELKWFIIHNTGAKPKKNIPL